MSLFICAGCGFLLAVLWFDLMFDVQALGTQRADLSEDALASIAAYYRRVTTEARPMNRLVAGTMLATLVAIALQVARDDLPLWLATAFIALAGFPIVLAGVRIVPNAARLGRREDDVAVQSGLARSICHEHLACFVSVLALLALQLWAAMKPCASS